MNDTTQQIDPAPTPLQPVQQPVNQPPVTTKSGSTLNTVLGSIVLILATLIVANGFTKYFPGFGTSSPIAVIDADLISAAGIHDLLQRAATMPPGAMEIETRKRTEALQQKLQDYRQRGYVVLDRSIALTWPASADITEEIAAAIAIPPSALEVIRAKREEQRRLTSASPATPAPTAAAATTGAPTKIHGSELD